MNLDETLLICFLTLFSYRREICYLYSLVARKKCFLILPVLVATTAGESDLHLNEQLTAMSLESQDAAGVAGDIYAARITITHS